jgi:uncharacterized protein
MVQYQTPGVYKEELFPQQPGVLRTGVPVFLGYAGPGADPQLQAAVNTPTRLALWPQFTPAFGQARSDGYLASAVQGFFQNQGDLCYVVRLNDQIAADEALSNGLDAVTTLDDIDLICAPDIMRPAPPQIDPGDLGNARQRMQTSVLHHCDSRGDRLAILDSLPGASVDQVTGQRNGLGGTNGTLYYPWISVSTAQGFLPPCGCVAGVYARSDSQVGVHKAPANEVLEGVLDLEVNVSSSQQAILNPQGVNCLRAFPGRGIRVWGARTVSLEQAWIYVNVRRLFMTAGRWIERNLASVVFEPNDPRLWARIDREVTAYFTDLFQRGALKGNTPQQAFYVKCDFDTNPPEVRDQGKVVTEIGLAPALPNEFIVVRITYGAGGVTITGPTLG